MFDRIGLVAEEAGHHPDLHLRNCTEISAELSTHSLGRSLNLPWPVAHSLQIPLYVFMTKNPAWYLACGVYGIVASLFIPLQPLWAWQTLLPINLSRFP